MNEEKKNDFPTPRELFNKMTLTITPINLYEREISPVRFNCNNNRIFQQRYYDFLNLENPI